jgi:hypothetical protein
VRNFYAYCTVGAFRTCASVQVETVVNAQGGTNVILRIQNLQGTLPFDNTGGSLITALGLTAPDIQGAANLQVSTEGSVGVVGTPAQYWALSNTGVGGAVEFSASTNTIQGNTSLPAEYLRGGILGCDNAWTMPTSYYQTCGGNGWVVFSFTTTNAWSANDAQIAFRSQSLVIRQGLHKACRTADPYGSNEYCMSVVPEPITLALLGSGLAGLGGVGLVRRRRGLNAHNG